MDEKSFPISVFFQAECYQKAGDWKDKENSIRCETVDCAFNGVLAANRVRPKGSN